MTYYSVIAVTPSNTDWIEGYIAPVAKLVAKHGGKYIANTPNHEQLEGAPEDATLRVILEWPSSEAAHAFMSDPDYAPFLKARTEGSKGTHFLIEGKD